MAKQKVQDVIDVGMVPTEDQKFVEQAGVSVREFLAGLVVFFQRATAIETKAKENLEIAKRLVLPTTQAEDETVQVFVRGVREDQKAAEAHWGVCQAVSQFHKKLTAGRARATEPNENAGMIATGLHNRYVETERRRAADEQERVRREAEQKAREEQERQSAALDALALSKEEASAELSTREQDFITLYMGGGKAEQAARLAGYKDPAKAASRLIALPKIQAAIKAKREANALRDQAAAKREAPVEVEVATVTAQVSGSDRVTWSCEVLDVAAVLDAWKSGKYGVSADLFEVNQTAANELARSLHERLNLIPGLRAVKKTGIR